MSSLLRCSIWYSLLERLLALLCYWEECLDCWTRFAKLVDHSQHRLRVGEKGFETVQIEHYEFRRCGKYWKRIQKFLVDDPRVLRVSCGFGEGVNRDG